MIEYLLISLVVGVGFYRGSKKGTAPGRLCHRFFMGLLWPMLLYDLAEETMREIDEGDDS